MIFVAAVPCREFLGSKKKIIYIELRVEEKKKILMLKGFVCVERMPSF